jgi:hypothetical protein
VSATGSGAFPHQHGDPRSLRERIDAQIRDRIVEATEMGALDLLVELRRRNQRPLPEDGNARDHDELRALTERLFAGIDEAFQASLAEADRQPCAEARAAASDTREAILAGQVALAKRLPDYWQRFEAHRSDVASRTLGEAEARPSWLRRLFGPGGR